MTQFITSTITGTTNLVNPATDSDIYVTDIGRLLATTGAAITATVAIDLKVFGTIAGATRGVIFNSSTLNNTVFIGETGTISGDTDAVKFFTDSTGTVVNHGTIIGSIDGIDAGSGDVQVINYGTITGLGVHGIELTATRKSTNYGTITGNQAVDIFRNDDTTSAVEFDNFGVLNGTGGRAIDGDSANPDLIFNAGTINGDVYLESGNNVLTNAQTGIINGDYVAFIGDDTLINDGAFYGDVLVSNGNDTVTNSSIISGDVELGDNDDTYTATASGSVGGTIFGGTGNDTITGGSLNDNIDAGEDNDRIKAKDGDDTIKGGDGNDNIMAGEGDDEVIAGTGDDILRGGLGDDTLTGGSGKDTIKGGSGDDLIEGGKSADQLTGGAGADIFLFKVAGHSTVANRDTITDFMSGADLIDISAFGATFISNAAFSGTGGAEVRFGTGGGLTRFEVDTDGDGNADMRVDMGSIGGLSEADFIL